MKVNKIAYELAIRLGDPVADTEIPADGIVFTEQEKLKYIKRAYGKLTRLLKILMRDYEPAFNKTKKFGNFDFPSQEDSLILPPLFDIDEVYVHYTLKGNTTVLIKPAVYMDPGRYLSSKYDINDTKTTSFIDGKFKYTVISNVDLGAPVLYMLPEPNSTDGHYYKKVEIMYEPDTEDLGWGSVLPITNQYVDLLIDLATIQGMQDIARADKAQLIERSIAQDWQILGQYGTYMKQTEGVKE